MNESTCLLHDICMLGIVSAKKLSIKAISLGWVTPIEH